MDGRSAQRATHYTAPPIAPCTDRLARHMDAKGHGVSTRPISLPPRADIVIIGGGIMGLSAAYHLALLRAGSIVVVEKDYLCSGASGRNGGGVRAQWSTETNIQLMKEAIRMCAEFAATMHINVWFRQGGYLFLARNEERVEQLEKSVALQQQHRLRTRLVTPAEASKIVPELHVSDLRVASYNPDDGVVFPWPFLWGYAQAATQLGVTISPFTKVIGIETRAHRIDRVVTARGEIETPVVINASGAWSPEIARMIGVQLPNHPHRHEICSTEPLKPFLGPLVADLSDGLYFSQSMRGEIVGGIADSKAPDELNQESSLRFLAMYSRALASAMPSLGSVRILRQWAGCYDISPDHNPLIGPVEGVDGFHVMCGFMGHGFMMAPVMGKLMAQHLVRGSEKDLFDRWSPNRFKGQVSMGETMILG